MFFFEKKNQKTSMSLDHACAKASGSESKNFLLLFYKKEALTSFP
jgi:hypothetical protein